MEWRRNYHTHSVYCDGSNTLEEMVQEALKKDFIALGFSGHAYTAFDTSYCMDHPAFEKYCREVRALQAEHADRLEILLGLEYDFYSEEDCSELDYRIGSVHYVYRNGKYYPVDESPEKTKQAIDAFGGDPYTYAEAYFDTVAQVTAKTGCDIIGHFDLIKKFNRNGVVLVDENHPRYIAAWKKAMKQLIPYGKPFEINTSTMAWRTDEFYPSRAILEEIHAQGGRITISGDVHQKENLNRGFRQALALANEIGFESLTALHAEGAVEIPIRGITE